MDEAERILFQDFQSDMKEMRSEMRNMNKNILYLCSNSHSTKERLKNIEVNMKVNNDDTALCMRKISKIEGKLIAASGVVAVVVSAIVTVLV